MSKAVTIPECNKDIGGTVKEDIYLSPNEKKEGAIGLFSRFLRLDNLGRRSAPESPTTTEPATTYFGVYIPCEIKKGPDEGALHVYQNKVDALELVKRYKLARFKAFRNRQDAVVFALRGAEPQDTTDGNDSGVMGEKPYPFKAPSPQDMVSLRKAIEAGLLTTVWDHVWDNPRYLVSSGNTPAILQEGSRYNALHVAAKALNAEMCNLILTTVGNPAFIQKLYGADADLASCQEFAEILVDRYLNTPDKAMNETPLHFAAKFGSAAAVDVLTSFPQCALAPANKYGETPADVICKRAANNTGSEAIASLLRERYYVPVLHSEDGSAPPLVGRAFTPAHPPELNRDPLSPRYEIRAFAGPMPAPDAEQFRRRWKTPPRAPRTPAPAPASPSFRLREMTKGLESVGRNLASQLKVGWKEYWPFLDTFTDLRSPEGLTLLENYLKAKYESACSFAYTDSCVGAPHSPGDLSISRLSLGTMASTPTKENTLSPMSELCVAMNTCKITDRPPHWRKTDPIRQRLCRQPSFKKLCNGDPPPPPVNHTVSQLLCIERTCQVFAKRLADALTFSLTAEPEVAGDSLKSEAKHLQHTILTYTDDERFKDIDTALIHSRLAQLVVYKLKQQTKELDDINNLIEFLIKLRCPNDDIFSSDDERKPANSRGATKARLLQVLNGHVRCLASFICEELTEGDGSKGPAVSEVECTQLWGRAAKCRCDWKIDMFERNSKKNASFRKNRSVLSTSPKSESFIRRLTFEHDIGDGGGLAGGAGGPGGAGARSVNSPAGDAALYTVSVANCQVLNEAEISEDDSPGGSGASEEAEEEAYLTASEHSLAPEEGEDSDGDMIDASDRALAEPFIYGEEPTKADRLAFEALAGCDISAELFPNVFRWRHTVALYSPAERDKWVSPAGPDESVSLQVGCLSPPATPRRSPAPAARSTPHRQETARDSRAVPLQVSTWLRVTGPNSPRSALAANQISRDHDHSFGF